MVALLDELDDAEVAFRSATEPFDTATPVGRMVIQLLGVFAEFEREVIIDRVINGMERKAAKGKWLGGPRPYGYHPDPQTDTLDTAIGDALIDFYTTGGDLITQAVADFQQAHHAGHAHRRAELAGIGKNSPRPRPRSTAT